MKTFFILCLTATMFTSCKKDSSDDNCGRIINMTVGLPDSPTFNGVNYYLVVEWRDGTQSNITKRNLGAGQFHTGDKYCK